VAGAGGTSWAAVEARRASDRKMQSKTDLGILFWDWGIPTAAALIEVKKAVKVPVIASGGLRNGLDVAKCLSLGAEACGMARPMIESADKGRTELEAFADQTVKELRAAMFVTGAKSVADLRRVRKVLTPPLTYWVN